MSIFTDPPATWTNDLPVPNAATFEKEIHAKFTDIDNNAIPRVVSIASSANPTPNCSITDIYVVTALAQAATFGIPTGTPTQGQPLIIRITDNGTARDIAFTGGVGGYRFSTDLPAPTQTTINKTMYLKFIWNIQAGNWDCILKLNNF